MTAQFVDRLKEINWVTNFFLVAFHVGAVAALFFFSWQGLILAAILWWVTGSLGIGMGYHRLLTHRSYKAPKWVEYLFTIFATMTLEGGPIFWVATHRIHHRHTDKPGDPHSPRDGKWWSHMGWITSGKAMHRSTEELAPFARDLVKDRFHVWISKWHWVPLTVSGIADPGDIRLAGDPLGGLPARDPGPALHVAREFGDASVGLAPLRHRGRFAQQLLGRDPHLR